MKRTEQFAFALMITMLAGLYACDEGQSPQEPEVGGEQPATDNNPVITDMFTADPASMVHDGVFYLYTGHDEQVAGQINKRHASIHVR